MIARVDSSKPDVERVDRRRRRARTVTFVALGLALLGWLASLFLGVRWVSQSGFPTPLPPGARIVTIGPSHSQTPNATPPPQMMIRAHATIESGLFSFTNRLSSDSPPGWTTWADRWPSRVGWWPRGPWFHYRDVPLGPSRQVVSINLPLWVPAALLLPLAAIAHWRVAGPARRAELGMCHACGYDLRSVDNGPCPECGCDRLDIDSRGLDRKRAKTPR